MKSKKYLFFCLAGIFLWNIPKIAAQEKACGFCEQTFIPVRAEKSHTSEQVTQLVFGDVYQILNYSEDKTWAKIENHFDKYQGWIPAEALFMISEAYCTEFTQKTHSVAADYTGYILIEGKKIVIPAGSSLPFLEKGFIRIENKEYEYKGKSQALNYQNGKKLLLQTARTYLGTPYLWGGKTKQGIDCSGFTQMVFKQSGFDLPRDSYQQAEVGKKITLENAQPGDVAFFQRKAEGEGKVVHVGIYLGKGKIIHADGQVRINQLDQKGIYRDDLGKHSHFLKFLRRME